MGVVYHTNHLSLSLSCSYIGASLSFLILGQSVGLLGRGIWPSQGRYLHRTTQTSMPWVRFEPTIAAFERAKTVHALNRAATVIAALTTSVHKIAFTLHFSLHVHSLFLQDPINITLTFKSLEVFRIFWAFVIYLAYVTCSSHSSSVVSSWLVENITIESISSDWVTVSYHSAWSLFTHSFLFWRVNPIQLFCMSAWQGAWKYTLSTAVKIYGCYFTVRSTPTFTL
jgi:hypothetical protein